MSILDPGLLHYYLSLARHRRAHGGGLVNFNPNEPVGYTAISDQPFDNVPPLYSSLDAYGWGFDRVDGNMVIVTDNSAPRSPGNVADIKFDPTWFGGTGGTAPLRLWRWFGGVSQTAPAYGSLYESVWHKHDAAWTDGGNIGTKFSFLLDGLNTPNANHYWGFGNTDEIIDELWFNVELQGGGGDRTIRTSVTQGPGTVTWQATRGVWNHYEVLINSNTPGVANGICKAWANGTLIINLSDVAWWGAGQTPTFTGVSIEPVYGGGLNPPPSLIHQYVDHFYVSHG